jgi:hypothetical protein
MIVGNPKAGRTLLTISIALLGLLLTIAAFVGLQKRTAPQKEPPLHPAGLVTTILPWFPFTAHASGILYATFVEN